MSTHYCPITPMSALPSAVLSAARLPRDMADLSGHPGLRFTCATRLHLPGGRRKDVSGNQLPAQSHDRNRRADMLKRTRAFFAIVAAIALAGCGTDRVRFIPPPPERMAPVAEPVIPPATTPCSYDASQLCNSDAETASALLAYDDALAKANAELEWLRAFFAAVPTKKP